MPLDAPVTTTLGRSCQALPDCLVCEMPMTQILLWLRPDSTDLRTECSIGGSTDWNLTPASVLPRE
jgi:hypothetical protein